MRPSNIYRNAFKLSRMVIREQNDDEVEINMNRERNDQYLRVPSAQNFTRSSIIRTHNGKFYTLRHSINLVAFIIHR